MSCLLCRAGVPGGQGDTSGGEHHSVPRSHGGTDDLLNKSESCEYHHRNFGHAPYSPNLWRTAKVLLGEATPEEYPDYEFDECADAMLGVCSGHFGMGNEAFSDGIPDTVKSVYFGAVDIRINDYCVDCCPIAVKCLALTRANLKEEIEESK